MAEKKEQRASDLAGSSMFRHVNTQTFGADATVEMAETITNPAYSPHAKTGMRIHKIEVAPDPIGPFGAPLGAGYFVSQLQLGAAPSTPVYILPNDDDLFAQLHLVSVLSTNGAVAFTWPMQMTLMQLEPIIIEKEFNLTHVAVNDAVYNSKTVHTIIWFDIVSIPKDFYSAMVMSRMERS